ncbi:MAG: ATP-binding protein [Gammaproteobacteria bacterium]
MTMTTVTALLFTVLAMVVYDLRNYGNTVKRDIETQTDLLASSSSAALSFDDPRAARENLRVLHHRERINAAAIYNARGAVFATYSRGGVARQFPVLPGKEGVYVEGDQLVAFKRVIENNEILGTAYIRADYRFWQRVTDYLTIASLVLIAALLVAALMSLQLQAIITQPILSVAAIAREVVTRNDVSLRAPKTSDDEVGVLTDAFNSMLDEIEARRAEITRLNDELEERILQRTAELEQSNRELESFSYSVSHDLRSPLRAIVGFSEALQEEVPDLPPEAQRLFERIRAATRRMAQRIDGLLNLAHVSRRPLTVQMVDLGSIAGEIIEELRQRDRDRTVTTVVEPELVARGDPKLLRAVLENLLENAWKFTGDTPRPRIEVGTVGADGETVYFVKDNGAGFDMAFADKLFAAFSRLHANDEFPGTGIGLATVQRIVQRHGGRIWAEAVPDEGAAFYFTLGERDGR